MEGSANPKNSAGDMSDEVVTRESLFDLAWSTPMTKISLRYGVSSSYLTKVYISLNIPRPPVGHWAQVAVGKAKARPVLPDAQPGEPTVWNRNEAPLQVQRSSAIKRKRMSRTPPLNSDAQPRRHPLLLSIEDHFKKVRESENGYDRPTKRAMADLIVSRSGLAHAVNFANQLFLAFMKKGLTVTFSDPAERMSREPVDHRDNPSSRYVYPSLWQPQRPTVVHVGSVVFGLSIYEISEYVEVKSVDKRLVRLGSRPVRKRAAPYRNEWVMRADMPSGRLCLQVYSPYYRAEWVQRWKEDKPGDLINKIPSIVKLLIAEAPGLAEKVKLEREKAELEWQKHQLQLAEWKRKEEEKRHLKAIQDSREQLEAVIQTWARVNSVRAFFADIEKSAQRLDGVAREAIMERLANAKELIGDLDALKHFADWKPPLLQGGE